MWNVAESIIIDGIFESGTTICLGHEGRPLWQQISGEFWERACSYAHRFDLAKTLDLQPVVCPLHMYTCLLQHLEDRNHDFLADFGVHL